MDFRLTDEQTMLRKTAREFVENVCPPEQAKAWDESGALLDELFKGLATLGWFALAATAARRSS
jgi:alkylation response protein AidB-like acyl-CoA dehydrogenase